jgi:hypothetical protein
MAVRKSLRSVQYGTSVDGELLCLIAFEVFESSTTRFELLVSFAESTPRPGDPLAPSDAVVVINFCGRKVHGPQDGNRSTGHEQYNQVNDS